MKKNQKIQRDHFSQDLIKYINGGCLSHIDILLSFTSSTIPFYKNAAQLIKRYQNINPITPFGESPYTYVNVSPYAGKNSHVLKMGTFLQKHLKYDLLGAYVHGSLGTYEETAYSDFDALVILKDSVFESADRLAGVARKLSLAQSIMFNFDPLQHHGWFVLTEADLDCYPESYFPSELFKYAKAMLPAQGFELEIRSQEFSKKCAETLNEFCSHIIMRIFALDYPQNMYYLKSLLSQFMLLPALYVQVRDRKGIFKKNSFDAIKEDFSKEDWSIMEEVSSLRQNWSYDISTFKRFLVTRPWPVSRFLIKKYAPIIPGSLKKRLSDDFYQRMGHLTAIMKSKLQ